MASAVELETEGKEFVVDFQAAWVQLDPQPGDILEVYMPQTNRADVGSIWASFLVVESSTAWLGAKVCTCKFIGSPDAAVNRELSGAFNRKKGTLHLCQTRPCYDIEDYGLHVTQVKWWSYGAFTADYITTAIRRQVQKWYQQFVGSSGEPPVPIGAMPKSSAKTAETTGPPDAELYSPEILPNREELDGVPGAENPESLNARREDLRAKLTGVRERIFGGGTGPQVPFPVHPKPGAGDQGQALQNAGEGISLLSAGSNLYALPGVPQAPVESGAIRGHISSTSKGPAGELLRQAFQVEDQRRRKKHLKKKRKDGSHQLASVLRDMLSNQKKKKKKKKQTGQGGDPSESEPSTGEGRGPRKGRKRKVKRLPDGTTVSCSASSSTISEDLSTSEESELEAPLKKRSRERPGSVMELLVSHVTAQLSQGSVLDMGQNARSLTAGVKIVTYFSLNVRPLHPSAMKELREMHTLAQSLDAMRRGDILTAGDILAARFMAIHQSLNDQSWHSAKHMEITPLEDSQAATPSLLLATRKHSKIFQKLQGGDPYGGGSSGFGRGRGRRQWSNWGQDGEKGDGGGRGKGKGGKQKGKNKTGGKNAQSGNPWAQNLDKGEEAGKQQSK